MTINLGDIYWIDRVENHSDMRHPYVVIQINDQNLQLCALTTNRRKISMLGNVLLDDGEANLPKLSIVEVYKIVTLMPSDLGDYIGTVSAERIAQIQAGMRFVERSSRKS